VAALRRRDPGGGLSATTSAAEGPADCLVCAMGKDVYLDAAAEWLVLLRERRPDLLTRDLRASVADRRELIAELARGPKLVVYLGHGRPRGWSGYQGVRWRHVEACAQARRVGVMLALACDTLGQPREGPSFGMRWVTGGRAAAYIGAAGPIDVEDGLALSSRLASRLASASDARAGELLAGLASELAEGPHPGAARALAQLRLAGDSLARLPGSVRSAEGRRNGVLVG
jgi:peptidase C25-like protein